MPNRRPDDELLAAALAGGNDCPPLQDLERLLNPGAPALLRQHVDGCSHCQAELQMLRAFTANEIAEHEKAAVSAVAARMKSPASEISGRRAAVEERRSWWKPVFAMRWLTPAAAVAALVLLAAGVTLELRQGRRPLLNTRVPATEVFRSSSIAILNPVGDLREKPAEVRWEAAPNAERYQVRLMEVDRAEVWSGETKGTRIELPAAVETSIVPAKTFLLQVAAFDATGRKIGESEPVRFRFLQNVYNH